MSSYQFYFVQKNKNEPKLKKYYNLQISGYLMYAAHPIEHYL